MVAGELLISRLLRLTACCCSRSRAVDRCHHAASPSPPPSSRRIHSVAPTSPSSSLLSPSPPVTLLFFNLRHRPRSPSSTSSSVFLTLSRLSSWTSYWSSSSSQSPSSSPTSAGQSQRTTRSIAIRLPASHCVSLPSLSLTVPSPLSPSCPLSLWLCRSALQSRRRQSPAPPAASLSSSCRCRHPRFSHRRRRLQR